MNWNEYQQLAARTLIPKPNHEIAQKQWDMVTAVHNLAHWAVEVSNTSVLATGRSDMIRWNITGLLGEVGELVDVVKKDVFHQHPTDTAVYRKEVGDVLWYWAACCTTSGLQAQTIAEFSDDLPGGYATALAHFFQRLANFVKHYLPLFTLEEAAQHNIEKLKQRYPNGFDPADSLKRVDVA